MCPETLSFTFVLVGLVLVSDIILIKFLRQIQCWCHKGGLGLLDSIRKLKGIFSVLQYGWSILEYSLPIFQVNLKS